MTAKWLPIKSVPKDGTRIFVYAPKSKLNAGDPRDVVFWATKGFDKGNGWFQIAPGYGYYEEECTHWQRLPEPPQ